MTALHHGTTQTEATDRSDRSVADHLQPIVHEIFRGPPPVEITFWDGSHVGAGGPGSIIVRSPDALRRLLWAPGELGLARAFVAGDLDATGDLADMLRIMRAALPDRGRHAVAAVPAAIHAAVALGLVGAAPPAPPEEIVPHGVRHSIRSRQASRQPSLRRRQRFLRDDPRPVDDLLVRPLRRHLDQPRGGAGRQARADLSQTRTGRRGVPQCEQRTAATAARRGIRMGVHGDPRRDAPRRRCRGCHHQRRAGRVRPPASGRPRAGRSGGDPDPGLPDPS